MVCIYFRTSNIFSFKIQNLTMIQLSNRCGLQNNKQIQMEICECCCIICSSSNSNGGGCIACCQLYDNNIKDHPNRRLRCLPLCFAMLFCIVAIIICIIEYALYSKNNSVRTILDNWKQNQIQQIYLTDTCDQHNIMSSYQVPQIMSGCYCDGQGVWGQACSSTQTLFESCVDVQQDDAFSFNYWSQNLTNGTYAPYYICQKQGSQNYFNQLQKGLRSKQDCSDFQMKICETTDSQIFTCVEQTEDCPITDIIIQSVPLSQDILNSNYWESLNSTDFYVYVTRLAPQRPIVIGKVIKGKGQCLVPSLLSLNANYSSDYVLNYPQAEDCRIDERFKSIALTLESELFRQNNVMDKIKKTRLGYPLYEIKYQFMVMNQIYLNSNCETQIITDLIDVGDNLDYIDTLLIVQLILSIIYLTAINFYFFNELTLCCYEIKEIPKMTYLITRWLFQYGFSFIIYYAYAYIVISEKTVVKLIRNNCFEEITQESLQSVIDNSLKYSKSLSVSLLIMIIILSVIEIVVAIFRIARLSQKVIRIKQKETMQEEQMKKQQELAKYIDVQMAEKNNDQIDYQQPHAQYY
ncbi:hypothetical protein pb186bvf_018545 [Paramecium bursaria]